MKKIGLHLEWESYPLCELDEDGYIIDDINPKELGLDNEVCKKIQIMQDMYDELFINTSKEFSYIGNKFPQKINTIKQLYDDISNELNELLGKKCKIEVKKLDI